MQEHRQKNCYMSNITLQLINEHCTAHVCFKHNFIPSTRLHAFVRTVTAYSIFLIKCGWNQLTYVDGRLQVDDDDDDKVEAEEREVEDDITDEVGDDGGEKMVLRGRPTFSFVTCFVSVFPASISSDVRANVASYSDLETDLKKLRTEAMSEQSYGICVTHTHTQRIHAHRKGGIFSTFEFIWFFFVVGF